MQGFVRAAVEYSSPKIVVEKWVRLPHPDPYPYFIYNFGDGVGVLTATKAPDPHKRQVVLLDSFKQAAGEWLITSQAGHIEKLVQGSEFLYQESPEDAAAREVFEESNVVVADLIPLGTAHRLPGNAVSRDYFFLALVEQLNEVRNNDEHERHRQRTYSWSDMMQLVYREPELFDTLSLSLILRANAHLYPQT